MRKLITFSTMKSMMSKSIWAISQNVRGSGSQEIMREINVFL